MDPQPPDELISLLARLGLATPGQVKGVYGRVRRLASDLPLFQSVWVDALAQSRIITSWQAAEINAGRGKQLAVGPFVLTQPLADLGYAKASLARHVETAQNVRLLVGVPQASARSSALELLQRLCAAADNLVSPNLCVIRHVGAHEGHVFAASENVDAHSAADWLQENGRLPPEVVLEVARQMVAALALMESKSIVHGDVSASSLLLVPDGTAVLAHGGVRAVLRPEEGYGCNDLLPEAYDYLAPERITDGAPASVVSDVFACGCLWWHLLTGRPPLGGGDGLSRLRASHACKIADARRLAPEAPAVLLATISACLSREPSRRPSSFARLATTLGPPTRLGSAELSRLLARRSTSSVRLAYAARSVRQSSHVAVWCATIAGCCLSLAAASWPMWGREASLPERNIWAIGTGSVPQELNAVAINEARPIVPGPGATPASMNAVTPVSAEVSLAPPDVVLPVDRVMAIDALNLRDGQTVRGQHGQRVQVAVPRQGLVIRGENIRLQNIDFRCTGSRNMATDSAMLRLHARRAEFESCTWSSSDMADEAPAAICWLGGEDSEHPSQSGHLKLTECAFRRTAYAVDQQLAAPALVEARNTLCIGGGPLLRSNRMICGNQPLSLWLEHCTMRDAAALLQLALPELEDAAAAVSVQAAECVFDLRHCVVDLRYSEDPTPLLTSIEWTGQGSLLAGESPLVRWRAQEGAEQPLGDERLTVAGLVRGRIEYAGAADGDASASTAVRWQAPLQSDDAPGIHARPATLSR